MATKNDHTERSRQENDNQWRTLLNTPGLSKTDMVNAYSDWAKNGNFDMDMLADGYQAPDLTVKYFSESFPKEKRDEIKILDIGAGTGLVARGLREEGFCHIDALDASEEMMYVARKDGLYDKYFCEILSDKPLSCFEPNTYDGLTASACFSSNHIPADAFRELTRIVKPGGIVVIVSRLASPVFDDNIPTLMETLEQKGKLKRMLTETIEGFFQDEVAIIWKFQVL